MSLPRQGRSPSSGTWTRSLCNLIYTIFIFLFYIHVHQSVAASPAVETIHCICVCEIALFPNCHCVGSLCNCLVFYLPYRCRLCHYRLSYLSQRCIFVTLPCFLCHYLALNMLVCFVFVSIICVLLVTALILCVTAMCRAYEFVRVIA